MGGRRTAVGWSTVTWLAAFVVSGCGEDKSQLGSEGNGGTAGAQGLAGDASGASAVSGRNDAGSTGHTDTGGAGGAGPVVEGSGGRKAPDTDTPGRAGAGGIESGAGAGGVPDTQVTSRAGSGGIEIDAGVGGAPDTGGTEPIGTGAAGVGIFDGGGTCAPKTQSSHVTQVNLVFVYDKSGSMGDDPDAAAEGYPRWQNMDLRWNAAKEAMTAFFQNPGAPEIYASLTLFPAHGDYETTCSVDEYRSPDVPRISLSSPDALISALDGTTPGGGTPTLPALMGSIEYATALMSDHPGSKSIIIMVTDGEPVVVDSTGAARTDNCPEGSDNVIDNIAAVASAAQQRPGEQSIPTYVIGIGEALDSLGAIASAGGTELMLIGGSSNEDTKARLLEALQAIRLESISCDLSVPVPEGGELLDFGKLNVNFVHSDAAATPERLYRDDTCSGAGWHYDNPGAPTKIILCPATCTAVQTDAKGHLEVELGCDTRVLFK